MHKILIIEDEEALLKMLAKKLVREGYAVVTAPNGEVGLAMIRKENPDLVLLDILMPKMGGMEVLERMHADKKLSKIPVIIISNSGQPVEIERAKTLGIRDYLVKAEFDPQEVIEKVKKIFEEDGSNAPLDTSFSEEPTKEEGVTKKRKPSRKKSAPAEVSVLVIEDDQFLRDLIIKKLEKEGLNTAEAIDGEEGLRFIREIKPMLVLLDLVLPGIDGFEVLKQLKADPEISHIPVVILSNLGQKEDIDRGLNLGAKDYLIKAHLTPGEIVEKVKEILKQG